MDKEYMGESNPLIVVTSEAQHLAAINGVVPTAEQVRDDVWSLAIAMPQPDIVCAFVSVLRDTHGGIHLIDAGFEGDENLHVLVQFLSSIGSTLSDVRTMTITHNHADHQGLALRIRESTGALIQMHPAEATEFLPSAPQPADLLKAWCVPLARWPEMADLPLPGSRGRVTNPDRLLVDGDRLEIPGFDVVSLHTPGHTPGHLTLHDETRQLLFTGDHLLPTMHPGLGLGGPSSTNPIADYLASLDRIDDFAGYEVLPGHGYRFRGVSTRAEQTRQHHVRRADEVAGILASQGDATVWQIAEKLTWTVGWENLKGFYLFSALSQVSMHREYVLSK